MVDGVPPELDAARDIHSRGDSAGITAAAGCNHTLFLVIDRWDDDAEVEEAGGRNQACDIAAQGLRNCTLDTEGCSQKSNWHVPKWLRMQGRTDDGAMLCRSHGSNWEQRLEALEFRRRETNCHIHEKHRGWGFGCNGRPTQSSLARLWPYMDEPGPWPKTRDRPWICSKNHFQRDPEVFVGPRSIHPGPPPCV